jgi:hypothetical protein
MMFLETRPAERFRYAVRASGHGVRPNGDDLADCRVIGA